MKNCIKENTCLCGDNRYKVIRKGVKYLLKKGKPPAKIIKCVHCDLARTFPSPAPSEFYNESDKGYLYMLENEDLWRRFAGNILSEISGYKPSGELLDVGCGIGILADEANKKGYQASGLEINPDAASVGRERYKVSLFNLSISQMSASDKRWDVVILNHVLEHLLQPVQFLSDCRRLLKEDGILYIGVPSYKSWTAIVEGKDWPHFFVDQHIWQWTHKTICEVVNMAGLSIVNIHSKRNNHYHFGGARGKIKRPLYRFFEIIGKGDQIILIAKNFNKGITSPEPDLSDKTRLLRCVSNDTQSRGVIARGEAPKQSNVDNIMNLVSVLL
ncbi:MAG: class I SAM-dependent methyltransferase [Nitrospinae bacterium]|nr:class I SAM-dependent methyltransferase [Nitrospinota bacterium]